MNGKLLVFDGIDGTGKKTQTAMMAERLAREGYKVFKLDFPQYGKKSAGPVEEYLNGAFGPAHEVGPYKASIFYATDRYAAKRRMEEWLREPCVIVSDRYVSANAIHQGGSFDNHESRVKFFQWLWHLEYAFFGIPRPTATFLLDIPPAFSKKLLEKSFEKKSVYLQNRSQDIHEEDTQHQIRARAAALDLAATFPEEFRVIECVRDGVLRTPGDIHEELWKQAQSILLPV